MADKVLQPLSVFQNTKQECIRSWSLSIFLNQESQSEQESKYQNRERSTSTKFQTSQTFIAGYNESEDCYLPAFARVYFRSLASARRFVHFPR